MYEVVKCGSFGHNIRSRPNLKATPVGRVTMGNQVSVVEEVCFVFYFDSIRQSSFIFSQRLLKFPASCFGSKQS